MRCERTLYNELNAYVKRRLNRNLERYYFIIMIDATFRYIYKENGVSKEAYCAILGVKNLTIKQKFIIYLKKLYFAKNI